MGARLAIIACLVIAVSLSLYPGKYVSTLDDEACGYGRGWTRLSTPDASAFGEAGLIPGTTSIAITWTAPQVIYASGLHNGLMRSDDCGKSWIRVSPPDDTPPDWGGIDKIAIDHDGRLYIARYSDLVRTSDESRQNWQTGVVQGTRGASGRAPAVEAFAVAPASTGLVFASFRPLEGRTPVGIGLTRDGGATWTLRSTRWGFASMAASPEPDLVYGVAAGDVYSSADAGETFEKVTAIPDRVVRIAMSTDGSHLWLAAANAALWLSLDQASSWQVVQRPPEVITWRDLAVAPGDCCSAYAVSEAGEVWVYRDQPSTTAPTQIP